MKVGIIGCSGHYRFAVDSIEKYGTATLGALASAMDGQGDAPLREIAEKFCVPFYEDWREMLGKEDLDIAEVDSRYDLHAQISAECLNRGLHVFCEKPLAATEEELELLTNAWRGSGKALGGMFNLRLSPWFLALKNAVDAGEIGAVRMIHGQKSYKLGSRPDFYRERSKYTGLIPWVAIHALDWALALGGDCACVSAQQSSMENRGYGELEMTASVLMRLKNEVIATVSADFLRPIGAARHDDDRIRVTGTRGMIEVIDGRAYLENDLPRRALDFPEQGDVFGEFVRAIGRGEGDRWAREALNATRVSLLARRAADENRTINIEEAII